MEERKRKAGQQEDIWDSLTGIYNRRGFYLATQELFDRNPDTEYVIAYWNVQRFKVINELFGREVGDGILIRMAEMIKSAYRGVEGNHGIEGTYGRMESDNFALCFPARFLDGDRAFVHSGEIIYVSEGAEYRFSSCYGLYHVEDRSVGVAAMVDRSRLAMDTVKTNYVRPFAYYKDSMRERVVMEQILMSECERAVDERQFMVYYQPVCDAVSGQIMSAEALVRWKHPQRGMISPGVFIPLFERNGFVSVLDRYVWDTVCRMLRRRLDEGKEVVPVSINVSRVDFYNQQLCENILQILDKYGLEKRLLRLEVTESSYSDDPQHVLEIVKRLQDNGFTIMMDDFGSGYSSLNTLKDLPVDILKIDMKFMDDLEKGGKSAIILESIVRMAKWMSLKAVAEGVETEEELNFLKSVECNYIQGYYFYRPMPEAEFEEQLDQRDDLPEDANLVFSGGEDDFMKIYSEGIKGENLFQNMLGGLGIYELVDGRMEIVRANKGYCEMLMEPGSTGIMSEGRLIREYMYEEDYEALLERCGEAERTRHTVDTQLRRKRYDGSTIWLDVRIHFLGNQGKRRLFCFYIVDISGTKRIEMENYTNRYAQALLRTYDKVYRLDYDTGYAEVLHSGEEGMEVGDKVYFRDFFDRFDGEIVSERKGEYRMWMQSRDTVEKALRESGRDRLDFCYRMKGGGQVLAELSKVTTVYEGDGYLACVKKRQGNGMEMEEKEAGEK